MSPIVSVLTPNIKTAEDYKSVLRRLSEIGIDYLDKFEKDPDISMDNWQLNAVMVYRVFQKKLFARAGGYL